MKLLPVPALFLFLTFSALTSEGQVLDFSGARFQAMADASAGLSGCWSVFGNQAGLAGITRPEVAGSFQNRFMVAELSARAGLFALPVQSAVVALSLYQFGEIPFRQEKFGLSFARRLFPKLDFGLQFNYYRLFLSEANRSVGSAGLELGVQYLVSQRLTVGFHVLNPYQTAVKTFSGQYDYPSRINLGALYRLSASFSLAPEAGYDFAGIFRIKTGMEFNFQEKFYLRAGISSNPYQLSSGIGFQLKKLAVDFADSFHSNLGNSPSVSVKYQF